jgi:cytochrome b-561
MGKGAFDEIGSTRVTLQWFSLMVLSSQVVGVLAIILLAIFFGQYRGGFGWTSDINKEFNYHPLFMTLGMIFFYGDAILAYRVFRDVKKLRVKILHGSLLALSFIFASIGLKAVFDNHNFSTPPIESLFASFMGWSNSGYFIWHAMGVWFCLFFIPEIK